MIYVVGDSHALTGFFGLPEFAVLHLGPRTAFNLMYNHHDMVKSALGMIPPGVQIIFCFGAIDCSHHIDPGWIQKKDHVGSAILQTAGVYTKYVSALRSMGFIIDILSISPIGDPSTSIPDAKVRQKEIVEALNRQIKANCSILSLRFIDVYDHLVGLDGYRKKEYIHDGIHLDNNVGKLVLKEYFGSK